MFTGSEATADTVHAAADTLHAAAGHAAAGHAAAGGEHGGNLFTTLLHHVQDSHELDLPFLHIELPHLPAFTVAGITFDMSITKHVVFLWFAAALLIGAGMMVARRNSKSRVPTGFGNLIEVFIVFVRDDIVVPN